MALCTDDRVLRMARTFIKNMEPHGAFLTGNLRSALLARDILSVVTAQDEDSIKIDPADVFKLHSDVMDRICFLSGDEFYFR